MAYEQVQKPSSSFVPVKTKVSELAPSASKVQAKDDTASEQEQMPKVSTPATDANWLMKHPLFKGNQFLQREVAPQSESESLESEEETLQRQEEGNEAATPYSLPVQAKLTIGEPGDKYEQEADRVASQVVKQINSPEAAQSTQGQSVQRREEPVEELQRQPSISDLQRTPLPLEVQREAMPAEEFLQAKSLLQRREAIAGGEATNDLDTAINSARGGGQSLDAGLQRSMGQAMGADFSGVKVHTDAQSDQLNQSIQAKAFTTGQDVFFRQGAYDPGSRGGQELIAHELTHVVQQNGGAVQRSPQQRQTVNSLDGSEKREGHNLEVQLEAEKSNQERLMLQAKWAGEVPLNSTDSEVKAKLIELGYSAAANIPPWKITRLRQDNKEYVSYEKIAEALGLTTAQPPTQQNLPPKPPKPPKPPNLPPKPQNLRSNPQHQPPTQQNQPPTQQEDVAHSSREPHIEKGKESFSDRTTLIPKTLKIKNLFRGDNRQKEKLAGVGFQPGRRVAAYEEKLQEFMSRSTREESERASRMMINREMGLDLNAPRAPGEKPQPPTDLVGSLDKIEISGGKKLTLLNYVCTGPETGAGTTSYLIAVDEEFECVAASPTIGLYQSSSGMKIIAVAQSAGPRGGYAMFTEYDFLTPISPQMIYYASNDGGATQVDDGKSWFRVTDQKQR